MSRPLVPNLFPRGDDTRPTALEEMGAGVGHENRPFRNPGPSVSWMFCADLSTRLSRSAKKAFVLRGSFLQYVDEISRAIRPSALSRCWVRVVRRYSGPLLPMRHQSVLSRRWAQPLAPCHGQLPIPGKSGPAGLDRSANACRSARTFPVPPAALLAYSLAAGALRAVPSPPADFNSAPPWPSAGVLGAAGAGGTSPPFRPRRGACGRSPAGLRKPGRSIS